MFRLLEFWAFLEWLVAGEKFETKFNFPFYRVHWNKLVQEHVWSSFFLRHCLQGCALRFVCTIMHQLHQDFRPDLLSHLDISSCQRFSVCNKSSIRSERLHHGNSVRNNSSFIFLGEVSTPGKQPRLLPEGSLSLSLSLSPSLSLSLSLYIYIDIYVYTFIYIHLYIYI